MTIEELISYGFKEWPINRGLDKHDRHWQYCVRDKIGKKYFVQVRLWEFSKYSKPDNPVQDGFDAYCQFDMHGPKTFNVDLSVTNMTPAQVVEWFGNVFDKLGCTYYESANDENCTPDGHCETCGAYITIKESYCPKCQYQIDTGFKRGKYPRRKKK